MGADRDFPSEQAMNSTREDKRWKKQEAVWLLLAMLAHTLLLFMPISRPAVGTSMGNIINISLEAPSPAVTDNPLPAPTIPSYPHKTKQFPGNDPPQPAPARPDSPEARSLQEHPPDFAVLTAAGLLENARDGHLDRPAPISVRQLGIHARQELPRNWQPASLPGDNLFNGMTVPDRTEIVDRWLAADGSHHVVLNLPNGETVCGRAEAWNPLQPLVENLMMFARCGGGGKRTFSMASNRISDLD